MSQAFNRPLRNLYCVPDGEAPGGVVDSVGTIVGAVVAKGEGETKFGLLGAEGDSVASEE